MQGLCLFEWHVAYLPVFLLSYSVPFKLLIENMWFVDAFFPSNQMVPSESLV